MIEEFKTDFFRQVFRVEYATMNQSAVSLLTSLHAEWMQRDSAISKAFAQLQIAQANLVESQQNLQDIDEQIEDAWCAFNAELKEKQDADDKIWECQDHDDDTLTPKEASRSARSQARRPLFGNKSSGGRAHIVKSENGNKRFKTCIVRRGEDVYTRPDRQSQHIGGEVRGMSPAKGFHYSFPKVEDPADQQVYTTFAFKKQRKDFKKNKSRRDRIFVE